MAVPLLLIFLLSGGGYYWYYRHKQAIIHGQNEASAAELRRMTDGAATGMMVNPINRGKSLAAASAAISAAAAAAAAADDDEEGNGGQHPASHAPVVFAVPTESANESASQGLYTSAGVEVVAALGGNGAAAAAPGRGPQAVVYAVPAESTGDVIVYSSSNAANDADDVVRPPDENNIYDKWGRNNNNSSNQSSTAVAVAVAAAAGGSEAAAVLYAIPMAEAESGSSPQQSTMPVYAVSTRQKRVKQVETNDNFAPAETDAASAAAVYAIPFEVEGNGGAAGNAHIVRTPNPMYQSADDAPPATQFMRTPNPMYDPAGNNTYDTNTSSA